MARLIWSSQTENFRGNVISSQTENVRSICSYFQAFRLLSVPVEMSVEMSLEMEHAHPMEIVVYLEAVRHHFLEVIK